MEWTKDIPTREGWYWVNDGETVNIRYVFNNNRFYKIDCSEYSFAGPIPEPKNTTEDITYTCTIETAEDKIKDKFSGIVTIPKTASHIITRKLIKKDIIEKFLNVYY